VFFVCEGVLCVEVDDGEVDFGFAGEGYELDMEIKVG
jgi:hypothetical protein